MIYSNADLCSSKAFRSMEEWLVFMTLVLWAAQSKLTYNNFGDSTLSSNKKCWR